MKYTITIEGGFTGIPKEYEGILELEGKKEKQLLSYLEDTPTGLNESLRDGRVYRIKLTTASGDCEAVFDDSNLPGELRRFIDKIRSM